MLSPVLSWLFYDFMSAFVAEGACKSGSKSVTINLQIKSGNSCEHMESVWLFLSPLASLCCPGSNLLKTWFTDWGVDSQFCFLECQFQDHSFLGSSTVLPEVPTAVGKVCTDFSNLDFNFFLLRGGSHSFWKLLPLLVSRWALRWLGWGGIQEKITVL